MDFALSQEQQQLRDSIVRFARGELSAGAAERDRDQVFARAQWLRCGELCLQGLCVPEDHGGAGLDALSTAIALEALGYGCADAGLVFSVCAHLLSCVVPVWHFGSERQRRRYLPELCRGRLVAVNAMTEPSTGSDAFALRTRAIADGDGFRLTGTKTFASNAPVGDLFLVFAVTDPDKRASGGLTAFLVERGAPGLHTGASFQKMGLRSSPIGEVVLEDVPVGPEAVLGGIGGGSAVFAHAMDWERTFLFASHVGQMERALEHAIEHARTRVQFGRPVGGFQAIAHRIADMKVRLEAARLLVYRAAFRIGSGKNASLDASIAKLFVSEALVASGLDCMQIHGGYGYMTEGGVERALRDGAASTLYSGTSEMQRNIIARWLGLPPSS